jgi:bifunctional N-acetylglucosamine-1-phosphate-uridyltransferase/glucosamine-1-phosphate-acetyltransferase GlmU-like protein
MNPVAILLCAGKGTRMKDTSTHKVCYEIAGIPAIVRSIDNFKKAGIVCNSAKNPLEFPYFLPAE